MQIAQRDGVLRGWKLPDFAPLRRFLLENRNVIDGIFTAGIFHTRVFPSRIDAFTSTQLSIPVSISVPSS